MPRRNLKDPSNVLKSVPVFSPGLFHEMDQHSPEVPEFTFVMFDM